MVCGLTIFLQAQTPTYSIIHTRQHFEGIWASSIILKERNGSSYMLSWTDLVSGSEGTTVAPPSTAHDLCVLKVSLDAVSAELGRRGCVVMSPVANHGAYPVQAMQWSLLLHQSGCTFQCPSLVNVFFFLKCVILCHLGAYNPWGALQCKPEALNFHLSFQPHLSQSLPTWLI